MLQNVSKHVIKIHPKFGIFDMASQFWRTGATIQEEYGERLTTHQSP